ncbi:hypothetical protein [Cohnella cellulosilytica]|uniref:hypothetical protein n=1 Tax=Cohnella cellulosilytica TaxID=986710 RepID=UPI00360A3913
MKKFPIFFYQNREGFIAIYIGAHGVPNHLDPILDVAAILKDQTDEIKFLFIGEGVEKKKASSKKARRKFE